VETLQKLTRRQLDTLQVVAACEVGEHGGSLKAIAGRLGVSPPSALGHVSSLESHRLVVRFRGKTRLSAQGRGALLEYRRHHRIAEGLFSRLGFPPSAVCAAAREVDLALSHRTIERMCDAEGHPVVCPHGEAIPPCPSRKSGGAA
jgi:Mn-dependent DtxR family transcriptional regulator